MQATEVATTLLEHGGPLVGLVLAVVMPLAWLFWQQIKMQRSEGLANRAMIQAEGEANRKMMAEIQASNSAQAHQITTAIHELRDMFLRLDGRLTRG